MAYRKAVPQCSCIAQVAAKLRRNLGQWLPSALRYTHTIPAQTTEAGHTEGLRSGPSTPRACLTGAKIAFVAVDRLRGEVWGCGEVAHGQDVKAREQSMPGCKYHF